MEVQEVQSTDNITLSFDELLAKSCRIYQEIGRIYDHLHKNLTKSSHIQLSASQEELECLLQEAKVVDTLLKDYMQPQASLSEMTRELLASRRELIAVLQLKNRKITQNAVNVRSHIRHELEKFGKNRVALKGYKPSMSVKKCLINTIS